MTESLPARTLDCDLCIVGAGYAALNGLNAAAKYLPKGSRVVVIDKNDGWGGQWTRQYDFVRLHQPYRMFTAGDQPWLLKRDPGHLASRREVLDHLASVPAISAGQLEIEPLFGHAYRGHRVHDGRAEVDVVPVSNGQRAEGVRVRARRLLKATGADIEILPPFPLSSTRVRSVGVADPVLMTREFLDSDAPVYIIGSGKTAMDTVRHLAQSRNGRRRSINIVIGSGMWFFVRDALYTRRHERFLRGELAGDLFLRIGQQFDGQNEQAIMRTLEAEGAATTVFGEGGNCRLGLISRAERDEVLANVDQVHRGHLVDVDAGQMILRVAGARQAVPVADGSWFINCTGHLRQVPHEPVLQDGGLVCAPQFGLGFTGTTAFYLTHLWFRDSLAEIAPQLYRVRIDVEPKLRIVPQLSLMVLANMGLISRRLPFSVQRSFRGDFNKWYPLHRQLLMVKRMITSRADIARKAEQLVRLRFADPADDASAFQHREAELPAGAAAGSA